MTFKEAMLIYLKNQGKDVNYLAKKLNISVQSVYAKERPSIKFIRQFCDLMNCYIVSDGYTYNILDK
jgi:Mor family transcriptional regulator